MQLLASLFPLVYTFIQKLLFVHSPQQIYSADGKLYPMHLMNQSVIGFAFHNVVTGYLHKFGARTIIVLSSLSKDTVHWPGKCACQSFALRVLLTFNHLWTYNYSGLLDKPQTLEVTPKNYITQMFKATPFSPSLPDGASRNDLEFVLNAAQWLCACTSALWEKDGFVCALVHILPTLSRVCLYSRLYSGCGHRLSPWTRTGFLFV